MTAYQQAANTYRDYKGSKYYKKERAYCLSDASATLCALGRYTETAAAYRLAQHLWPYRSDISKKQASSHYSTGDSLLQESHYAEALDSYRQALEIYRQVEGTEKDQADCQAGIDRALRALGLCRSEEHTSELQSRQ